MSEKKGASTKLLGCVGCLGILLIGGVGVGLVGALGVGGFLAYNTASPTDIVQFDQTTPPGVVAVGLTQSLSSRSRSRSRPRSIPKLTRRLNLTPSPKAQPRRPGQRQSQSSPGQTRLQRPPP
jgi:hypothetical protein